MYRADYCLKHFKLVFCLRPILLLIEHKNTYFTNTFMYKNKFTVLLFTFRIFVLFWFINNLFSLYKSEININAKQCTYFKSKTKHNNILKPDFNII